MLSVCPPGGVPRQAEEGADRGGSGVVPGSLQPAQPAAEGEAEGAGELVQTLSLVIGCQRPANQREAGCSRDGKQPFICWGF